MNIKEINRVLHVMIKPLTLIGFLVCFMISCDSNTETSTINQLAVVRDSVQMMAESIARDVSREGPAAWLRYFKNTPDFFMASEGQLVFPNYDSAAGFIKNTLIKNIRKIELQWNNIRINPLTNRLASLSANFHEDITDQSGKTIPEDGYFTGIAQRTSQGWQLCNAHWSTVATK